MERTEPVNPEKKISLWLLILLYPAVSGYKLCLMIPSMSISDYWNRYQSRSFSFAITFFAEFSAVSKLFPTFSSHYFKQILIAIFLCHGSIELIFDKKIEAITNDCYSYYSKAAINAYLLVFAVAAIGFVLTFNSMIGHVS